jgi:hypothetical protein
VYTEIPLVPVYALFVSIWATIFIEFWKRKVRKNPCVLLRQVVAYIHTYIHTYIRLVARTFVCYLFAICLDLFVICLLPSHATLIRHGAAGRVLVFV